MEKNQTLSKHMDKMILRFFIIVFFLSTPVFAYVYMKSNTCKEVFFSSDADTFRQDELIKFTDNTESAKSWQWDFGDSTDVATIKNPLHVYKKPGEYAVKLIVNGFCERTEVVTIEKKLFVLDSTKFPVFSIPEKITVGEELTIKDLTANASTWEWRFGETSEANSKTKTATYTYETPGIKTISLIVNGDIDYMTRKQINVIPEVKIDNPNPITGTERKLGDGLPVKPPSLSNSPENDSPGEDSTAPKAVPHISEKLFKEKLVLVSKKLLGADAFKEYFCDNLDADVVANGKKVSFIVFCERIKSKNLKIRDLDIYRKEGTNCINTVTIKHRRFLF